MCTDGIANYKHRAKQENDEDRLIFSLATPLFFSLENHLRIPNLPVIAMFH